MSGLTNMGVMKRQRQRRDIGIGGMAARWYDKNTKRYRLTEMKEYAEEVARLIHEGSTVLEVAPGPGYLSIEIAKLGRHRVTGLEISKDFVAIARRNAAQAGVEVDFRQGTVADMPFPDNMFDFIVCTAAFKNFMEPDKALSEMYRVLKPGCTALIVDMNRETSDQHIDDYTGKMGAKGLQKHFMKLMFKHFLRNGAYTRDEFNYLISKTEFSEYHVKEVAIGFHIYLKK
jgi:ubiquinone/menaquinone biosynthesis C-methylase UbiE